MPSTIALRPSYLRPVGPTAIEAFHAVVSIIPYLIHGGAMSHGSSNSTFRRISLAA